jgi:hypothetical protein
MTSARLYGSSHRSNLHLHSTRQRWKTGPARSAHPSAPSSASRDVKPCAAAGSTRPWRIEQRSVDSAFAHFCSPPPSSFSSWRRSEWISARTLASYLSVSHFSQRRSWSDGARQRGRADITSATFTRSSRRDGRCRRAPAVAGAAHSTTWRRRVRASGGGASRRLCSALGDRRAVKLFDKQRA